MKTKKVLLVVAAVFIFSACAGVGIPFGAKSEFEKGLSLFNQGKYEKAIPYFQKATEIDPDFGRAYLYLGRSYLNTGKWLAAVPPLRTAFRLSPGESRKEVTGILVDALLGAALFQFQRGNFQDSVAFFREVLELQPGSFKAKKEFASALIAFGGEMLSEGNLERAIEAYTEAATLSPNSLDAYLGLARAFFRNGEFFKALQAAQNALEVDPTNKEARFLFNNIRSK